MIDQVLPDTETRTLETENVYVATIEPKQTNNVLKFIRNQLPPTKGLEHLKQIRKITEPGAVKLDIILCQESALSLSDLNALVEKFDLATVVKPRIHGVSLYAPLTRNQFELWKTAWPTTFREDTSRHPEISESELETIMGHMKYTWELTKEVASKGELPSVATIVDPATQQVRATAHDTRNSTGHVLNHAVMKCVEAVAKREREAFEQRASQEEAIDTPESDTARVVEGTEALPASPACGDKRKEHPTNSDTSLSSSSGTRNKKLAGEPSDEKDQDDEEEEATNEESSRPKKAYLCSGYDVYLTHEPCVMCSMALVHSRVGRVFYTVPMKASGGLGSVYKIHSHPNLNHHFFTYRHVGYEEVKNEKDTEGTENKDGEDGETEWTRTEEALKMEEQNIDC